MQKRLMQKRLSILLAFAALCCVGRGQPEPPLRAPGPQEQAMTDAQITAMGDRMLDSADVAYSSDYFSFVGEDATGHVAFAIDNNRGRDGAAYQAEHFAILHDEQQGFIPLPAFTRYPNPNGELRGIPDSELYTFQGSRHEGLVIRARQLPLELEMGPIELRVGRIADERGIFYMGSAPATLRWNGRTLRGRVIEEYLIAKGWNRMTASSLDFLLRSVSFQGLYLRGQGDSDIYVHRTTGLSPFAASVDRLGFFSQNGKTEEAQSVELTVQRKRQGLGLFRWPDAWRATWQTPSHGQAVLDVEVADFKRVLGYGLGGFGMAIVKGTIEQDGARIPVYGWGELVLWRA